MNRRLIATPIAAAMALTGVWYVVLWSPQSSSLRQARATTAAAVAQQHKLGIQVASLQHDQTLLPGLRAQLAVLNRAIPTTANIDQVIDTMNGAATGAGVTLTSLSQSAPSATTPPASSAPGAATAPAAITVSISVSGSYFKLIDFVNRLTAMPRLTIVNGLTFVAPGPNGVSTLAFSVKVFLAPAG